MSPQQVPGYAKAVLAKRPRKFAAVFIDFLFVLILTALCFAIGDGILTSTAPYKESQNAVLDSQERLYQIVEESHLSEREEGKLLSVDTLTEEYLKASVLYTLQKQKDPEDISTSVYKDVDPITPKTDGLYSYYVDFKTRNKESFSSESQEKMGREYYVTSVLGKDAQTYFDLSEGYPFLNVKTAEAINDYYVSATSAGEKVYSALFSIYADGNRMAQEDLTDNYAPYVMEMETFDKARKEVLSLRLIVLLTCYLLGILVVFLLFPLLFGSGRTLSDKILDIGLTDIEGKDVGALAIIVRLLLSLISYLVVPFLLTILLFGGAGIAFMDINVFSFYNVFAGAIVSLLYLLVSGLFDLWKRQGIHQTLTELLAMAVMRDGKEFMVSEEKDG